MGIDVIASSNPVSPEQTVESRDRVSDSDEFTAEVQARWIELGVTDADFEDCDNVGLQRTESKRRNLALLRLRALEAGVEPLPANY